MHHPLRSVTLALSLVITGTAYPAPTDPAPALTARIIDLERVGRAHPNQTSKALESLRDSTAPHSAQRLELLTVQGLMLATAFQIEAAEHPAALLEAWGKEAGASLAQSAAAAAMLVRARGTARSGNLALADTMMRDALALLPAEMAPRDRFRFVLAQGYIKYEAGKLEDAVRIYHEALALADRQDQLWRQSEARSFLAYGYYGAGQLDRANALATEAWLIAERAQDLVAMGRADNISGIVLDGLGDQAGERRSFERAIKNAHLAGAKIDEVRYLANLSDFYLKTAEYKTALDRAERALVLARELHDSSSETVALANIGLAQISLQHIELGKRSVREAIAIDHQRGSITGESEMLQELGTYLEKAGDWSGAMAAYQRHRRLATTLLREGQQKAILAMQEQYDADDRSRALALLNRENQLKAEQLRRRDLQQGLWALLGAASLLSLAVVGLLYRRVRHANRLLDTSNELLKVQTERDPLTGLSNRRHFQAVMRQLAQDGKLSGTVYLVDIDHFKRINDRHGHATGDAVLVEVARRLRETLRQEDLIVRWGGEEFLVIVQGLDPGLIDALAQRMLAELDRTPVAAGAQRIAVTASIGFATFPIGPTQLRVSWERAINLVDTAMYLAKAHGRNRAYGVRLLRGCDEAELETIMCSLEAACRDGQVALTLLEGRAALAVAA